MFSDSDPDVDSGRARKRVRIAPVYETRRVLLVGVHREFREEPTMAKSALARFVQPPVVAKWVLGIAVLAWGISTADSCGRDASISHDICLAALSGPTRASAKRFLDYRVLQAGWVDPVPFVAGEVAQVVSILISPP